MSCHAGIISSLYESNRVSVIQINASVNSSNSGGPLFDPSNGQVIGIVTRKATGLTNMFDEMKKAVQANIKFVESGSDNVRLSGISFRASLVSQQRQMLSTLEQIERSANVGIGYAFSTEHLLEEPRFTERNG